MGDEYGLGTAIGGLVTLAVVDRILGRRRVVYTERRVRKSRLKRKVRRGYSYIQEPYTSYGYKEDFSFF